MSLGLLSRRKAHLSHLPPPARAGALVEWLRTETLNAFANRTNVLNEGSCCPSSSRVRNVRDKPEGAPEERGDEEKETESRTDV